MESSTNCSKEVLEKNPSESTSDKVLLSRKMIDDDDDNAWMIDNSSSLVDEAEDCDKVLPFGLNHSWPSVSGATSMSSLATRQRPRPFLRQISQESLDESTSLLLGHVVMLPDLPQDPADETSLPLDMHFEIGHDIKEEREEEEDDGDLQGTTPLGVKDFGSRLVGLDCCEAKGDGENDEGVPSLAISNKNASEIGGTWTTEEESGRTSEHRDEAQVCLRNSWVGADAAAELREDSPSAECKPEGDPDEALHLSDVESENSGGAVGENSRPADPEREVENVVCAMIADMMIQEDNSEGLPPEKGSGNEDKGEITPEQSSPGNSLSGQGRKRPPLVRHISRESIEESTCLLRDHVVVMDLKQKQQAGMEIVGESRQCPFLLNIAENPLVNEDDIVALSGEEDRFLYRGEVDSSDIEEEEEENKSKPKDTVVSPLPSVSASSIISDEAASTLKDIELIRVDLDDAIQTLENLKDEFPDRTVDVDVNLPNGDRDSSNSHKDVSSETGSDPGTNGESTGDCSWFNRLPDEVILLVFHYLSHAELCRSVVLVCKKWHHLALDPLLWQHLDLSFNSLFDPGDRDAVIRRCSLLRSLTLRGLDEVSVADIEAVARYCPRIRDLDLGFVSSFDGAIFDVLVSGCQTLTTLNVEGCDHVTGNLVSRLIFLPRLEVLRLSHCTKLSDETICEIARFCSNLQELDIDGIPWITDNAVITLVKERRATLQRLKLDGAELTDLAVQHALQCPGLEELNVSFCEQLTDKSLDRLKEWESPRRLRLQKGKEFSEAGLVGLFDSPNFSGLTRLNLSECSELKDQGMISIANRCPLLTHLAVEWCWSITDAGLVQVVDNCRHLVHLDLIGLHAILGHYLADIPTKLPRLEFLDLRQCNLISDAMLVKLVHAKHDLVIMNYYGEEVRHNDIPSTLVL